MVKKADQKAASIAWQIANIERRPPVDPTSWPTRDNSTAHELKDLLDAVAALRQDYYALPTEIRAASNNNHEHFVELLNSDPYVLQRAGLDLGLDPEEDPSLKASDEASTDGPGAQSGSGTSDTPPTGESE